MQSSSGTATFVILAVGLIVVSVVLGIIASLVPPRKDDDA